MKRSVRRVLTSPYAVRAAFSLNKRVAPIFMLHRFRDREAGNEGHDPAVLRANLAWLRSNKCSAVSLPELLDRLATSAPIERTIAFTVDDGYADFARVGAPVFAEFDCPVTVFLTTGFLDGREWMWWDKVAVALTALGRAGDAGRTTAELKMLPEADRLARIELLVRESGAGVSAAPPPRFAPVTWDDVRRLAHSGVTFGPHTVTHPVLSRTAGAQSQFEISESWRRVRAEAGEAAVPVFCYPNGEAADYTAREEASVAANGMRAAMASRPGYSSGRDFAADHPSARFGLPRFSYSDDRASFIQIVSGIERAKMAVRAATGRHP